MIGVTIFNHVRDKYTDKTLSLESFDQLETLLYNLSKQPAYKPSKDEPPWNGSALISPARFDRGDTRANDNVIEWAGWCALDVDEGDFANDLEGTVRQMSHDHRFVCYSTASSTKQQPKFRLVFELSRRVQNEEIPHFWFALNKLVGNQADQQTKDKSRMFFVPGQYPDAYNFIFSGDGAPIDPDDLMNRFEYIPPRSASFLDRFPPEIRDAMLMHKQKKLTNTSISWSSYQDCPFVSKKILDEYQAISETGWYHKMYAMMVAIAGNAIRRGYPITAKEIADLCSEIDRDTGAWYQNRPLVRESENALQYAYTKV